MMKPHSPTQAQILITPAQYPAGLAVAPPNLPVVARNAVIRSMLNAGALEEVPAPSERPELPCRQEADGSSVALRATVTTLQAVGLGAAEGLASDAASATVRASLRAATFALLKA
jgi:hypothetical protein